MKALLLALGALTSLGASAQRFSYGDWAVSCDNTRHCEAVGYQREDAELPVTMWLARDAGGNAPVTVRIVRSGAGRHWPVQHPCRQGGREWHQAGWDAERGTDRAPAGP
jgi:hypothetical protein